MPAYDFRCKSCGRRFTARVPISEKGKVRCEECGGEVEQLFTSCNIIGGSSFSSSLSSSSSSCASPGGFS